MPRIMVFFSSSSSVIFIDQDFFSCFITQSVKKTHHYIRFIFIVITSLPSSLSHFSSSSSSFFITMSFIIIIIFACTVTTIILAFTLSLTTMLFQLNHSARSLSWCYRPNLIRFTPLLDSDNTRSGAHTHTHTHAVGSCYIKMLIAVSLNQQRKVSCFHLCLPQKWTKSCLSVKALSIHQQDKMD